MYEDVGWIQLTLDMVHWSFCVNVMINLRVL
jgi:hypothetical protein